MPECPKCRKRLVRTRFARGFFYGCPGCQGRAVGLAVLRRAMPAEALKRLWRQAREHPGPEGADCPSCGQAMVRVPVKVREERVELELCTSCQWVWFDAHEFEAMPRAAAPAAKKPLPDAAREAIAMVEVDRVARREKGNEFGADAPDDPWKLVPAFFGMPVECDAEPLTALPVLTWSLSAAIVLVFMLTWVHLDDVVRQWGLVPAQLWRHGGSTLVTSFFLHAGIFHLVSNVYFLVVFGDNVEDYLGRWRYGLLLVSAAVVGAMVHVMLDPRRMIPCVGASCGISGVITFYALSFPRARLGFVIRYWYVYHWLHVPAWTAMVAWFLLQLVLAWQQVGGGGTVSALGHLGGAAVGLNAWLYWRKRY